MLSDKLYSAASASPIAPKPEFFDLANSSDQAHLEELLEKNPHTRIIDTYQQQLQEYFVLQNPPLYLDKAKLATEFATYRDNHYGRGEASHAGKWVYLSWRHTLLHLLDDDAYQTVRTGRNRNLITAAEQQQFYHSTIGIAGLSVGSSIAMALVQTGGGKHLKLADPDTLELTNLNRIRGSIAELTEPKVYMAARQIYELDPYAELELFTDGLTESNIKEFFQGLDVIVDEIDQLAMKIHLREHAKKQRIPLLSAVDNGDSGILDIERHDLDDTIKPFHGRGGDDLVERVLKEQLPPPLIGRIIGEHLVGYDVTEPRMQESLLVMGKDIPTWPQLGTAAWLNGVVVAAAIRRILNDQPIVSERVVMSVPAQLVPGYTSDEQVAQRARDTAAFAQEFNARIDAVMARLQGQDKEN